MALPPIDENATWLTGLGLLGAVLWKVWLRLKSDHREDRSDKKVHDAGDGIIDTLREEVARLAALVQKISNDLDTERRARWKAEDRIQMLEYQIRGLGHIPRSP